MRNSQANSTGNSEEYTATLEALQQQVLKAQAELNPPSAEKNKQ